MKKGDMFYNDNNNMFYLFDGIHIVTGHTMWVFEKKGCIPLGNIYETDLKVMTSVALGMMLVYATYTAAGNSKGSKVGTTYNLCKSLTIQMEVIEELGRRDKAPQPIREETRIRK